KNNKKGMYAYFFILPEKFLFTKRDTREGLLEWKNLDWVLKKDNKEIAENIKYFLPEMINIKTPMKYHCTYLNPEDKNELTKFEVRSLEDN
ncbi:MAG TPA: hypothetical protein VF189_04095, partial [Patescibacteria group bacterium]